MNVNVHNQLQRSINLLELKNVKIFIILKIALTLSLILMTEMIS